MMDDPKDDLIAVIVALVLAIMVSMLRIAILICAIWIAVKLVKAWW